MSEKEAGTDSGENPEQGQVDHQTDLRSEMGLPPHTS